MGSNPDGTVSCHFQVLEPKFDVKKLNDNDWLLVLVPKMVAPPEKR
jgi:hypothetical protein